MADTIKGATGFLNGGTMAQDTPENPAAALDLLAEMQALFTLMPGTLLSHDGPLPTEDEIEDMFDNMPV